MHSLHDYVNCGECLSTMPKFNNITSSIGVWPMRTYALTGSLDPQVIIQKHILCQGNDSNKSHETIKRIYSVPCTHL